MKNITRTMDIEFYLERRRYGSSSSPRFFVWLNWRRIGQTEWKSYGDPWPKVTPNKRELAEALENIRFDYFINAGGITGSTIPGSVIALNTGAIARVVDKDSDKRTLTVVLLDDENGKEYVIPPSAVAYA